MYIKTIEKIQEEFKEKIELKFMESKNNKDVYLILKVEDYLYQNLKLIVTNNCDKNIYSNKTIFEFIYKENVVIKECYPGNFKIRLNSIIKELDIEVKDEIKSNIKVVIPTEKTFFSVGEVIKYKLNGFLNKAKINGLTNVAIDDITHKVNVKYDISLLERVPIIN